MIYEVNSTWIIVGPYHWLSDESAQRNLILNFKYLSYNDGLILHRLMMMVIITYPYYFRIFQIFYVNVCDLLMPVVICFCRPLCTDSAP